MPHNDASPHLPPGTTPDDTDRALRAHDEDRESTPEEVRADMQADPLAHGLCVQCAKEAGEFVPHVPFAKLCETCLENGEPDAEALRELLRDIGQHGIGDSIGAAKLAEQILLLASPFVGSELGYRMGPDDRGKLTSEERRICAREVTASAAK
jgi:hypothetical protein